MNVRIVIKKNPEARREIQTKYLIQFPLLRPVYIVFKQLIFMGRILNLEEVNVYN